MKKSEQLSLELEKVQHEIDSMMDKRNSGVTGEEVSFDSWKKLDQKRMQLRDEIRVSKNRELDVGDGCTVRFYTDCHAATVIRRTKTTITVRRDKATLDPNWKPEWVEGGFSAVCTNQDEQSYSYEPNPDGETYTARWSERYGRYINNVKGFRITPGRHEYYDYNF